MNEYKIQSTNATFKAKTHSSAYKHLCGLLSVEGPRALRAVAGNGAVVLASLFVGDSLIADSKKRVIFRG